MAGVSVGTGVMISLVGKLSNLLGDEYKLLSKARKEVEFLKRELSSMNALLLRLSKLEELDDQTKEWRDKVREMSYDIEDCIDLFMHHLGSDDAKLGFLQKAVRRLKTLRSRHQLTSQVQALKAQVMEESERRDRYKLDGCISMPSTVEIDPRLLTLFEEAKSLVAIDGPRDQIVGWLMDGMMELKVVSIVGCGGIGKTTLAMEVYRKMEGLFQCRASVSVSRTLNLRKLLMDMLYQIDQDEHRRSQLLEKEQLIPKLREVLKGKRYLIIVDDVWGTQDWKALKSALPENNNGCRIITTTRKIDVAKSCCFPFDKYMHEMAPLRDDDSQRLFCRRLFQSDSCCPTQLGEVPKRILRKCGGLPLAIITIASLLATKSNRKEWEIVLDSIGATAVNDCNLQALRKILFLSYCDLPYHLKTCLLYLSIYPEDYKINRKQLVWRWIAEGFITEQRGKSLENTAEGYFNELVNRSVIQPVDIRYDGRADACSVHDMMLDLVKSMAIEENFVTLLDEHKCSLLPEKIRRLSSHCNYAKEQGVLIQASLHVRSLSTFGSAQEVLHLLGSHTLRVLDFEDCEWLENDHIKGIGSLYQLKYLRFGNAKISKLPKDIGMLQYLETLDLRGCYKIRELPPSIVRLKKLVRLYVEYDVMFPGEIGGMESLEELSDIDSCGNPVTFVEQLGRLTKLRRLAIDYDQLVEKCNDIEKCDDIFASSLCELGGHNLQYLAIHCKGYIVDSLMGSSWKCLQNLRILSVISGVPRGFAALGKLTELWIDVRKMDEEDLRVLGALPALLYLGIKLFDIPKERLSIGNQGLRHLKELFFHCIHGGTGVVFKPGAMPQVQRLHLIFEARDIVSKYGGVDTGIWHLSSLRYVHVTVECDGATKGDVEAFEASVKNAAILLPNHPTIQIRRLWEHQMVKDGKPSNQEREALEARGKKVDEERNH